MTGKTRGGFTLVELLITVSILATLSATMVVSIRGATAKTKAAVIASNVEACISAAALCVVDADQNTEALSSMDADTMLGKYMPKWADFSGVASDPVTYTAAGKGPNSWALTVDFKNEPEKEEVKKSLQKIKGYGKYYDGGNKADVMSNNSYAFKVMLYEGRIVASADVDQGD